MVGEEQIGVAFTGQIYEVKTKKDGSGRMSIDFGADAIEEIQKAQRHALKHNCLFTFALIPVKPGSISSKGGEFEEYIDPDTGEIEI